MISRRRTAGSVVATLTEAVRGSLWPIPAAAVLLALVLGITLPALDGVLERGPGAQPLTFAFGGGAAAARDLLAAIAGSLISVTGLTFSLTVVALQMASSQYTPRLLQTFVTDRVVQSTLAQLVLTFTYALTVLRTVRTESATGDETEFVPRLSVTVAYLLTLGSVVALVLFLGHLARALRVETLLRDVHDEAVRTVGRELGDGGAGTARERVEEGGAVGDPGNRAVPLPAGRSGFLVEVDEAALAAAARAQRAVVRLVPRFGDSVVAGVPVAHAWSDTTAGVLDRAALESAVASAVRLGVERTASRDIALGLRKITDIALRALSPGINDPTTAVHALSHTAAVLGTLAAHDPGVRVARDEDGTVRLVLPEWDLPALLQVGVEEPLQFAAGQPAVLRRLAALLREVAWRAPRGRLDDLIRDHLRRLTDTTAGTTPVESTEIRAWQRRVEDALSSSWPMDDLTAAP